MRDRIAAIGNAYRMASDADPRLPIWLALAVAVPLVAGIIASAVTGMWLVWAPTGFFVGLIVAMIVFGRRVQSAQFSAIEGMPGAAAAVLQQLRGQWFVVPAVAINKQQEMVHRAVGRPGIVLISEGGSNQRVKGLLAQAKKRLRRVSGDVPIHVVMTGDGTDGTVELGKLQVELTKLSNTLSKTEVPKLAKKLAPLDKGNIPMPKGAIPRGGRPR